MIIVVMPATELLYMYFKVPSTSCKKTQHHYLPHLDFIHVVGVKAIPPQEVPGNFHLNGVDCTVGPERP